MILFVSYYIAHLSFGVIRCHEGGGFHFYADDTKLYIQLSHKNASSALGKLNSCLMDIGDWMYAGRLKLKLSRGKPIFVFGSTSQRGKFK